MPWLSAGDKQVPNLAKGEVLALSDITIHAGQTEAPSYLSEADLIGRM